MITITFNADNMDLTIKGHAGVDYNGYDPVCSGISALFYTLCNAITDSEHMFQDEPVLVIDHGDGRVQCKPKKEYESAVQMIFWTILEGIDLMAKSYPENVELISK